LAQASLRGVDRVRRLPERFSAAAWRRLGLVGFAEVAGAGADGAYPMIKMIGDGLGSFGERPGLAIFG
jgi:hypothetical protein